MKKIIPLLLLMLCTMSAHAQINLVKQGKAVSKIIIDPDDKNSVQAADLLNDFIKRITGASLPVVHNNSNPQVKFSNAGKGDIQIGSSSTLSKDAFSISTKDGILRISGQGKGQVYGVVTLLEDYIGVQYYAENAITFSPRKDLSIASGIERTEQPSFQYRQTQSYSLHDPLYKLWHRLEEPKEVFAGNLWVHTFDRILPSSEFGKSHPEYYSFINGQRRPGAASQWCLTNEDLFELVAHRIDSIFKANPDKHLISVSQNDGNSTNCHCDACAAMDQREGGPSGSLIYFMNRLAERFPDKQFSTLAYLYSVSPPKHIKPLPNVNIMLCDIDCMREVTLTENPSGQTFVRDMEGWSRISNNIFVWDYGINFDNYISPFPNLHILQANMRLFKKNNASMHFSQIAGSKGGDFSELRSYLVAKLLWNTELNVDSLMQSFLHGYYGAAAPYLYQYIKMQEGALMASNTPLWIYDTPITHKNGMLNKPLMKRYKALFDQAEAAVASNSLLLQRVQQTRLPIQYAALEMARTEPMTDVAAVKQELELFRNRAAKLGVSVLNERNNTIEEYYKLYLERNFPSTRRSLAQGASINYILPPAPSYQKIADKALTDGLLGGATFNESWVGWEGKDADLIIDLGELKEVSSVEADFLHKLGAWILQPKRVSCYLSADGKDFQPMDSKDLAEDRDTQVKFVNVVMKASKPVKARYVQLKVATIGLCPSWHYGVGYPAWFFMDEVGVY